MGSQPSRLGRWVTTKTAGETVRAFIPPPLPPEPPLALSSADHALIERANRAIGRLDGLATVLPNPALFVYSYVRREAVLSSQIEGTRSSLSDLLIHELEQAPGVPLDDVQEVSRYVAAMEHGLRRLKEGFPLSLRLLREIHGVLLTGARGHERRPGEFRTSQNWIGGSRPGNAQFVPPPPDHLMDCLGDFEKFLHDVPEQTPLLIKAALAHVQFETIHPFLDGNGRLGRLLITLLFCADGALTEPLLYLSLHFRQHRQAYYDHLQRVRTEGDWESWVRFFAEGVRATADQAVQTARRSQALFGTDRQTIQQLGRSASAGLRVHEALTGRPILSVPEAVKVLNLSAPTITSALLRLVDLGLVKELTGRQRNRLFAYQRWIDLLMEGEGD